MIQDDRYGKSRRNRGVENEGIRLLLRDPRFQVLDTGTKRHLLELLGVDGPFTARTFDVVMTAHPVEQLTLENLSDYLDAITVVELKTTKKPIRNSALNGFFFGATHSEYALADALGDRHKWAFAVLSDDNDYGRPFFVLLTLKELRARTKTRRTQYQVNLRSDSPEHPDHPALRPTDPSPD